MSKGFVNILFIAFVLLLIINVFAYEVLGSATSPVTFENLLNELSNAPTLNLQLSDVVEAMKITYTGNIDIVSSLVDLLNSLVSVIGFLVWIVTLGIDLVSYIGYAAYLLGLSAFSAWI